jgi:hypothetical protein
MDGLLLSRSNIEDRCLRAAFSGVTTNDEVATNNASLEKVSSLLIPGKGSDRLRSRMAQVRTQAEPLLRQEDLTQHRDGAARTLDLF